MGILRSQLSELLAVPSLTRFIWACGKLPEYSRAFLLCSSQARHCAIAWIVFPLEEKSNSNICCIYRWTRKSGKSQTQNRIYVGIPSVLKRKCHVQGYSYICTGTSRGARAMFKGIPHYRTGGCRSESWETPRSLISVLPPFNDEGGLGVSIPGDSNSSGEVAPCVNLDHLWGPLSKACLILTLFLWESGQRQKVSF